MTQVSATTFHTDVAIVGGGPAGLACAIALSKQGVSSVIIERQSWPIDKVCGEGLMPTGVKVLKNLGIFEHLSEDMHRPFYGIRYIDSSGIEAEGKFPNEPGLGIRRVGLSSAMHTRAASMNNVALWNHSTLRDLSINDECAELSIQRGSDQVILRTRLVIGADGLRSKVREWTGLKAPAPTKQKRSGTRQHFRVEPWSDHVEVYWRDGFEAYVTPSSHKRIQVAFLWDQDRHKPRTSGAHIIESFLRHFPELSEKLRRAVPEAKARGIGPLAHAASGAHANRVLLIGDALGYVDGITGEGVAVALQQAEKIGDHLPALLQANSLDARGLAGLSQVLTDVYREGFGMVKPALMLTRHPTLRTMAIRGLSRSPGLFSHILASNMGLVSPLRPPLGELPKFVHGVVHPVQTTRALPSTTRAMLPAG